MGDDLILKNLLQMLDIAFRPWNLSFSFFVTNQDVILCIMYIVFFTVSLTKFIDQDTLLALKYGLYSSHISIR